MSKSLGMIPHRHRFLMIIGAMKAGTSALFSGLATHPEILGSINKEPNFWDNSTAGADQLETYLRCWDLASKPEATWYMEGSTSYTKLPIRRSPAPTLRHLNADLRFIYVTRNPIDRARSQYEMSLARGWIKRPLTNEFDPAVSWLSNYYQQITPYVDCFGVESIHVISHEELSADPHGVLVGVAKFLGLDPAGMPPTLPRVNEALQHRVVRRKLARAQDRAGLNAEELEQRLDAEVSLTAEHIARLHNELEHDLGLFEEMFLLNPWTGKRRSTEASSESHRLDPQIASLQSLRRA